MNTLKITYLGEEECNLYDLEIEDNHNFFANNILVHNCDTDSLHILMNDLIVKMFGDNPTRNQVENFLLKIFSEKIEPVIDAGYDDLAEIMGAYSNKMSMKLEKICNSSIYTGKKRYIMSTLNSEGVHYEVPKISVTGIESVRSSTPEICREKMKEFFKVIMNGDEESMQQFIKDFKEVFYTLSPSEIGKNVSIDDLAAYTDKNSLYKKGCPIHVRASLLYNNYLKEKGYENKYPKIQSGDKIKFVYLNLPNPIRENVVGFVDNLPKEFDLAKYVDYETQFEKVFLKPMRTIAEAVNWDMEKVSTLEAFFG